MKWEKLKWYNYIVYGFKTPDGREFYIPSGVKIIARSAAGFKLQYKYGDIETVPPGTLFHIAKD